jgi:hypothetical protein
MKDQDPSIDDAYSLEDTIDMMESSQLCFHPVHHHSFAQVTFLISGSMRLCAGCNKRLHSVLGYATDSSSQLVRCVACGVYAHRTCAMTDVKVWKAKCTVNSNRIRQENSEDELDAAASGGTGALNPLPSKAESEEAKTANEPQHQPPPKTPPKTPPTIKEIKEEVTMVWTNDGPPNHWANKVELLGLSDDEQEEEKKSPGEDEKAEEVPSPPDDDQPMEITESNFASVARAIQENVLVHFRKRRIHEIDDDEDDPHNDGDDTLPEVVSLIEDETQVRKRSCREETIAEKKERLGLAQTHASSSMPKETREALLKEVTPEAPPAQRHSLIKLASGTYEAAKTSVSLQKKLGMASVVGGIAGGVAGLIMAGPAGAVFGVKCGQTAGVLSVVIEGSVTVGVLVAGAAAGSFTAKQIQQQAEQRILAIGGEGSKRKVLLVRPHVWIDPAWEQICEDAKREAPAVQAPGMLSILTNSPAKQADIAKKERYQRDSDIVQTAEFELQTEEKVLLLVSRILNDRLSLPGHVYRALIKEHRKRSDERKLEEISKVLEEMEANALNGTSDEEKDKFAAAASTIRSRRLDAHAVIKHVTATLLEIRPGFASSPTITEMSATAVEGLVFGELYVSVFEEILEETRTVDEALMDKLSKFANRNADGLERDDISQKALNTLALIPESRSPVDKLRYCVNFLEHVSEHFSSPNKKAMGADSLLKMVCLHLVVANVPYMNSEVAFLEEFARDERLLQGKEGYALVTLQASLHFLNASNNFETDIFFVDDD